MIVSAGGVAVAAMMQAMASLQSDSKNIPLRNLCFEARSRHSEGITISPLSVVAN